jgi:hypothetical protein
VKNRIIDSVGEFYSIIVDETMDKAKLEQISFCIRYCDNNLKVHEKLLGFFETATTDSQSLYNLIKILIQSYKLNQKCLVGQSYDGAATMSGSKNGVAARILRDYNTAVFVTIIN